MGAMKNYLLTVLQNCSEESFGQEAVEHAIVSGALKLTGHLPTDLHQIFDPRSACCNAPPLGETHNHAGFCRRCRDHTTFSTRYDEFIVAYREHCRDHEAVLMQRYESSGLLEEIRRPVPMLTKDDLASMLKP
jgi:hypothetical protein